MEKSRTSCPAFLSKFIVIIVIVIKGQLNELLEAKAQKLT